MTSIQSILQLRRLKRVEQWRTTRFVANNSVAEHSFYVVLIAMMIAEELFKPEEGEAIVRGMGRGFIADVVKAALLHDAAECVLGDIPHPAKHRNGEQVEEIFSMLDAMARRQVLVEADCIFQDTKAAKGSEVAAVVKAADAIELGLTTVEEILHGNREQECWEVMDAVIGMLEANSIARIEGTLAHTFRTLFMRFKDQPVREIFDG